MNLKKGILFIHRWLGFISGLVVFIVSVTGCIFCFQNEIQDAVHSWRKIAPQQQPYVAPSALKKIALNKYPKATADYIYYFGNDRPAAVLANVSKAGYTYVYINPYTGQLLHTEGIDDNFFTVVESIHLYLLLPPAIGQWVVGVSVMIFVVLMITGIILWWPKRKTDRKRSFTIKWNGRWRRVNYDLHNVLGFYAASIAIILAVTGLAIDFDWMDKGIYKAINAGKSYPQEKIIFKSDSLLKAYVPDMPIIDKAFFVAEKQSPQAKMFLIGVDNSASGTVTVSAYPQSMHYAFYDNYAFDKYTGQLLQYLPNNKKSPGMKMNDMNYDIHVGQVLGLTGKIGAFLASLICASLPVTGFMIWLGKWKKPKKVKKRTCKTVPV